MVELQIVKLMRREARWSAELRHLLSMSVDQARRVFAPVRLIEIDRDLNGELPQLGTSHATLLIGDADVLVTRHSLGVMLTELSRGCEIVVPSPLHEFASASSRPVHSLSEFEALERAILKSAEPPEHRPVSHLPVALAAPQWLRRTRGDRRLARLLTDETLLQKSSATGTVGHAGVYFELADYYGQRRDDILPLLPRTAGRVLEVGCGRGRTAEMVGKQLGCPVTGVELNPEVAREAAERIDRVIVGDIMEVEIDDSFDVIIATEVLEHVQETEAFLRRMKGLLAPGGRLIMSIPNVGHYSVVADLLSGRWDYVPAGLLCITHVRFFTRRSLSEWCARAGFAEYEIHPQQTEVPAHLGQLVELPGADRESLRTHGFLVVCIA